MNFQIDLILSIVCGATITALFLTLAARPLLGILQQEGYSGAALCRHFFKRGNMLRRRLALLSLSLALLTALFPLCFSFLPMPYAGLFAILPHAALYGIYLYAERKHALKVPLVPTPRALRLAVACAIIVYLAASGAAVGLAALSLWADVRWLYLLRFVPLAVLPLLLPFLLAVANLLMKAFEIPHARKFVRRAEKTLAASGCVKVGITGSYGKTSVKYYAAAILGTKYRVKATPASYNTPLGVARYVNERGCDCEIFLAEMGARKRGDIAELCDMVKPTVGVVTGVCPQHLETFRSQEAIFAEKGILAARTERTVLGSSAAGMAGGTLVEGRDFAAEEIVLSPSETKFTLRLGGERAEIRTRLLGRHAAENIALAAALCSLFGMTFPEIAEGIKTLCPVAHRLVRSESNGVVILDDSYNSNVEGAKNALEVLRLHEGRKAVVTPGLVELGEMEEEANEALGASLAGLDLVVLVGETRVLSLRTGYLAAGGAAENLAVVPDLASAQEVLRKRLRAKDCVLFLNDLPDKYL